MGERDVYLKLHMSLSKFSGAGGGVGGGRGDSLSKTKYGGERCLSQTTYVSK